MKDFQSLAVSLFRKAGDGVKKQGFGSQNGSYYMGVA